MDQVHHWATASEWRHVLTLTRAGIPFDVAICMSAEERVGTVIALGELDGSTFDWSLMRWTPRT